MHTRHDYNKGCRCDECRAAVREYAAALRRRKAALVAAGEIEVIHGTMNAYANLCCRCDLCREANTINERRKRAVRASRQ